MSGFVLGEIFVPSSSVCSAAAGIVCRHTETWVYNSQCSVEAFSFFGH